METPAKSRLAVARPGGIDRTAGAAPGDLFDCLNVTSRDWPALRSTAAPASSVTLTHGSVTPFFGDAPGMLCADGTLVYDGEAVAGWDYADPTGGRRWAASLGDVTVFFPDKAWFNCKTGEGGKLEFSRASASADLMVTYTDEVIPTRIYSTFGTEPPNPPNSALWICHGGAGGTSAVYRYYESSAAWVPQQSLHYRVAFPGVGAGVAAGSTVTVAALTSTSGAVGSFCGNYRVYLSNAAAVILTGAVNYRVLADLQASGGTHYTLSYVRIERTVPDAAMAVTAGDRVWAADAAGAKIWSCAAGDPFTWRAFHGGDGDSCELDAGASGAFTGVCEYGGKPVFFKENSVVRLRGSRPDNFALDVREGPGVSALSPRGIGKAGGAVFYAAPDGRVYRWSGGVPRAVSDPLARSFTAGVCVGGNGDVCVVSDGTHAYTYDLRRGLWHRFAPAPEEVWSHGGTLYLVCVTDGVRRLCDCGRGECSDGAWSATFAPFAPNGDHGCVPAAVALDMESDGAGPVKLAVSWDGDTREVRSFVFNGRLRREVELPQRRCDTLGLTLSGRGRFALRSFTVTAAERG